MILKVIKRNVYELYYILNDKTIGSKAWKLVKQMKNVQQHSPLFCK